MRFAASVPGGIGGKSAFKRAPSHHRSSAPRLDPTLTAAIDLHIAPALVPWRAGQAQLRKEPSHARVPDPSRAAAVARAARRTRGRLLAAGTPARGGRAAARHLRGRVALAPRAAAGR